MQLIKFVLVFALALFATGVHGDAVESSDEYTMSADELQALKDADKKASAPTPPPVEENVEEGEIPEGGGPSGPDVAYEATTMWIMLLAIYSMWLLVHGISTAKDLIPALKELASGGKAKQEDIGFSGGKSRRGNKGAVGVAGEVVTAAGEGRGSTVSDEAVVIRDAEEALEGANAAPLSGHVVLLLYLNDKTFLDAGGAVARLVQAAMDRRIAIAPVHEQDPASGGVPFRAFFQQTPQVLQQRCADHPFRRWTRQGAPEHPPIYGPSAGRFDPHRGPPPPQWPPQRHY